MDILGSIKLLLTSVIFALLAAGVYWVLGTPLSELTWWLLAFGFYVLGDTLITRIGVTRETNIEERMPVTRLLLGPNPSVVGLVSVKAGAFLLFGLVIYLSGGYFSPHRDLIPVGIFGLGLYAVLHNLKILRKV